MDRESKHLVIMHQIIEKKNYENYDFQRSNIQNVDIQDSVLDGCDFSRSSLTNLRIINCKFYRCKFLNIDLCFCKFTNCEFTNCDFTLSEIENVNFFKCMLYNIPFISSRIANNNFIETSFTNIDLNGSTTKFNNFEMSKCINSVFGNCTIDYNIAIKCKFINTKMNLETLGSLWGIQETELDNISFLSLGREITDAQKDIYKNYTQYLIKKRLCLEIFTFQTSFRKENVFLSTEQLLDNLNERYKKGQYLSPDELHYLYEVLKAMRKESMLPLLILKQILSFFKELLYKFSTNDSYYETVLLFYNNICLIYNSIIHELSTYQNNLIGNNTKYQVRITFQEKPKQDIVQVFNTLYQYVYNTSSIPNIQFVKDEIGSYIVWIIMPLAALAAFNIGTLLLTGGVKHLIKLRASTEVLFSKKLPRKYYLDVYERDDSEELAKAIISKLLSIKIPSELHDLSYNGINAQNIKDISAESN
ncbi:pentapeptide repeat-containing protein [Otoolea muris]|uniref:pentapeptide repeat-containing protein n=1 Tax=Otoolea muris TaxID=2941515 RepID=UPI00204228FE|nr:pentapeptide repeat-containing protein [Otoolea muris]